MNIKKIIGMTFLGLVVIGALAMTAFAVKAYRAPLGPALQITIPTTIPASPQVISTPIPTIEQANICGESTVWNVLILGTDTATTLNDKGSDLTRIARIDFLNKKVTVYAFPRDLWVDTVGLGLTNPTINATQLGMVFYEARSRSPHTNVKNAMIDGTSATARMLSKNFLINIDHYLTIDLYQIPAMVDTIGGVSINIPVQVKDPVSGRIIPAGQQTLNGVQFMAYARAMPDSDFGRMQRNNLLLTALREKLLNPSVWGQIPQFYAQFSEAITTDLSPEQINHLTCLLQEVPANAIIQDQVRQEWTWPGPQRGSLLWDKTSVLNRLKELGLIP